MDKRVVVFSGDEFDSLRLQAIMNFPEHPILQEQYLEILLASFIVDLSEPKELVQISRESLQLAVNAPSLTELKLLASKAAQRAVIAGDLLAIIYVLHVIDIPEPSMNKALHICKKFAEGRAHPDGTRLITSKPKIRKHFQDFKSVAHYWAALRLLVGAEPGQPDKRPQIATEVIHDRLGELLAFANGLLGFGQQYVFARTKSSKTLLDSHSAWKLPQDSPSILYQPDDVLRSTLSNMVKNELADYDANEYNSNYR